MTCSKRGFSLLEVMIALTLLSIGMVTLLQSQARSMQLASQASDMTVATQLARGKLLDCQADLLKKGFSVGDYNEQGNFGDDGYPSFFWECHAYEPKMPEASGGDISGFTGTGDGEQAPDMGMSFLQPILGQMSGVMGKSVRELVVIVRWGIGDDRDELEVATHVVDRQPVLLIGQMLQQQCRNPFGGGGGGGGGGGPPLGGK
jgi:general secretion pathway protein I